MAVAVRSSLSMWKGDQSETEVSTLQPAVSWAGTHPLCLWLVSGCFHTTARITEVLPGPVPERPANLSLRLWKVPR